VDVASLLHQIHAPEDVKRLPREQLPELAAEIRQLLLETLAKTGGHLGANLGVVELTLALHYVFDSPRDRLIWDVSHQCYTHKLLTGRREDFTTLRQLDGLSGFAKRAESPHDAFDAGHGGTSLSAALGMVRARALRGESGRVVAVIGDGALTNGMALEALNDAGHGKLNLLVILNDNAMAISPNVGAMARYLNRVRSEPGYLKAKAGLKGLMERLPGGRPVLALMDRVKESFKHLFVPGMLFEELGFTYQGPVDGQDTNALIAALQSASRVEGPVLLHVLTTKCKGYEPAEHHRSRLHGVPAFDLETGEPIEPPAGDTFTEAFGAAICRIAERDPRVVAVSAAMCEGTGLTAFRERFPDRCFDVGMAEEHAVTLAAGMACEGLRPVIAIYSTFLQRAYDQVLHDVCLQDLPVVLALDRAGLVGEDGPTHHGAFDLSFLRMMPNLTVMAPATLAELEAMLAAALVARGPCAIRYPKGRAGLPNAGELADIARGKAAVLREGGDVALIAVGAMVSVALAAADLLARKEIHATVVNARFIKPLDIACLLEVGRRVPQVVTLEENAAAGGFGSAVQELFAAEGVFTPVRILGLPDAFVGQGPRAMLLARLGFTPRHLAATLAALHHAAEPEEHDGDILLSELRESGLI